MSPPFPFGGIHTIYTVATPKESSYIEYSQCNKQNDDGQHRILFFLVCGAFFQRTTYNSSLHGSCMGGSRSGMLALPQRYKLLKLFAPTNQVHPQPISSLAVERPLRSILELCFSGHSLLLCLP